jgi:ankyrin repeat protein
MYTEASAHRLAVALEIQQARQLPPEALYGAMGWDMQQLDALEPVADAAAPLRAPKLLQACSLGHAPAVADLLRRGCSARVRDSMGAGALHAVASAPQPSAEHLGILDDLMAAGAEPGAIDAEGRTAVHHLMAAEAFGPLHPRLLQALRALDVPVDAADAHGTRPLHLLCNAPEPDEGHLALLQALLRAAPALDAAGPGGHAALHMLCLNTGAPGMRAAMVGALIAAGASANVGNARGITPLMVACWTGCDLAVLDALAQHPALQLEATDADGNDALDWALSEGHVQHADWLTRRLQKPYRAPQGD